MLIADTDSPQWLLDNLNLVLPGFSIPLTFVHLGDAGIGFYPEKDIEILLEVSKLLSKHNSVMFIIRGNHDDPKVWPNKIGNSVYLVPDYYHEDGMLFIGGAVSPDKNLREPGLNWWPEEVFKYEKEKVSNIFNVVHVFTHTAPAFVFPLSTINKNSSDPVKREIEAEMHKERLDMSKVFEILTDNNEVMTWSYGHFHKGRTEYGPFGVKMSCVEKKNFQLLEF